jgi:hypothetical protein
VTSRRWWCPFAEFPYLHQAKLCCRRRSRLCQVPRGKSGRDSEAGRKIAAKAAVNGGGGKQEGKEREGESEHLCYTRSSSSARYMPVAAAFGRSTQQQLACRKSLFPDSLFLSRAASQSVSQLSTGDRSASRKRETHCIVPACLSQ